MPHAITLPDGCQISDDRARIDMAFVHRSLATTYWAERRTPALTERSWANCLCFGIYAPGGGQLGFGRLLTDYAFRAHLGDVFIHPDARGRGLGKALVRTILGHPELATVTLWTLTTQDAHSLYAQYGFRLIEGDGRAMLLVRPEAGTDPA